MADDRSPTQIIIRDGIAWMPHPCKPGWETTAKISDCAAEIVRLRSEIERLRGEIMVQREFTCNLADEARVMYRRLMRFPEPDLPTADDVRGILKE